MLLPAATSRTIFSTISAVFLRSGARLLLCLSLGMALSAIKLEAQEAQTPRSTDDDEVIRVNTDLLVFPIRVRDRRANAARLTDQDLLLKDNDHVTSGMYLYPGADRVALVFALDESGSLRTIISQQQEAALALFSRFGERSRVAVIRFAEKPLLVAPFGRDISLASEAFNFPVRTNQHTAIFDAADTAVAAFAALPKARSERRIVILISDGLDNASTTKANSVINAALEKQVSFYVIHLPLFTPRNGRLAVRTPARGFRDLAEKTGGRYFLVGDVNSALSLPENRRGEDLTAIFRAIEEDLRSQYLLGFYAGETSRDGRKHLFSVSVPAGVEYKTGTQRYSRTQQFSFSFRGEVDKPAK
jgi:Ca-activated chloride channel family protein